jgi:hypothetical protein
MRHPVSTPTLSSCCVSSRLEGCKEGESPSVVGGVVVGAVLPASPQHARPGASEDTDGVRVIAAAGTCGPVDGWGPVLRMRGVVGPGGLGLAEALVAGEATDDCVVSARGMSDGRYAGFGGELFMSREAQTVVAKFGEDLSGIYSSRPREGLEEGSVRVLLELGSDEADELAELMHDRSENGDEATDELSLGLALEFAADGGRGGAQALQQQGGGPATAVGMALEETLQTLLTQARGAFRSGEGVEEGESDGAVDVRKDSDGSRPEAVEETAQLIGELDSGADEVSARANECAQRLGLITGGSEGPEAVAIGTQDVGEDVGITRITLAPRGTVARAGRLEGIRVNGNDDEAGVDEGVDQQARRTLDGDGDFGARSQTIELPHQLVESVGGVVGGELVPDLTCGIDHTHGMLCAGPIDADEIAWTEHFHAVPPSRGSFLCSGVGRSHRSLTEPALRASGALALHPVVGWGLPRRARERVSCRLSQSERRWLSSPGRRSNHRQAILSPAQGKVHQ